MNWWTQSRSLVQKKPVASSPASWDGEREREEGRERKEHKRERMCERGRERAREKGRERERERERKPIQALKQLTRMDLMSDW